MTIDNINRPNLPNRAGLQRCFFMFQKHVKSVLYTADTYNNNVSVSGAISIETGSKINELYFTPGSAAFNLRQSTTQHGNFYDVTLSFDVPADRQSVSSTLKAIGANKVLCVYKDKNENIKLLPNLRLEFTTTNGTSNNNEIRLQGKYKNTPKFWTIASIDDGFTSQNGTLPLTPVLAPPPTGGGRGCIKMQDADGKTWTVCIGRDGALESTLT